MITKIVNFWWHSWETDRKAFVAELISFVLTVGASLTLAVTADQPDMRIVYPGFFSRKYCRTIWLLQAQISVANDVDILLSFC